MGIEIACKAWYNMSCKKEIDMDRKDSNRAEEILKGIHSLKKKGENKSLAVPKIYGNEVELSSLASTKEIERIQVGANSDANNKEVEQYFANIDGMGKKGSLLVSDLYKEAVNKGIVVPSEIEGFEDSQVLGYGIVPKLLFAHVFDDGEFGAKLSLANMDQYRLSKDSSKQGCYLPAFKKGDAKLLGSIKNKDNIVMKLVKVSDTSFKKFFDEQKEIINGLYIISARQRAMLTKSSDRLQSCLAQLANPQRMSRAALLSNIIDSISDLYEVHFPQLQQVKKNPSGPSVEGDLKEGKVTNIMSTSGQMVDAIMGSKDLTEVEFIIANPIQHMVSTGFTPNGEMSVKVGFNNNAPVEDITVKGTLTNASGDKMTTTVIGPNTHKLIKK